MSRKHPVMPAVAVVTDPGTDAQRAWYTFRVESGRPQWAVDQTMARAPGKPVAWLDLVTGEFEHVEPGPVAA